MFNIVERPEEDSWAPLYQWKVHWDFLMKAASLGSKATGSFASYTCK